MLFHDDIQIIFKSYMSFTIKVEVLCVCPTFLQQFIINSQTLYRLNYQVSFNLETKAKIPAYNCS